MGSSARALCIFFVIYSFFGLQPSFGVTAANLTSATQGAVMYQGGDVLRSTCINNLPDSPDGTLTNFVGIVSRTHLVDVFFFVIAIIKSMRDVGLF